MTTLSSFYPTTRLSGRRAKRDPLQDMAPRQPETPDVPQAPMQTDYRGQPASNDTIMRQRNLGLLSRGPSPQSFAGQMNSPMLAAPMAMRARQRANTALAAPRPASSSPGGRITYTPAAGSAPIPGYTPAGDGSYTRELPSAPRPSAEIDQVMASRAGYAGAQNDLAETLMPGDAYRRQSQNVALDQAKSNIGLTEAQGQNLRDTGAGALATGQGNLAAGGQRPQDVAFYRSEHAKAVKEMESYKQQVAQLSAELKALKDARANAGQNQQQTQPKATPVTGEETDAAGQVGWPAVMAMRQGIPPGSPTTQPSGGPVANGQSLAPSNIGSGGTMPAATGGQMQEGQTFEQDGQQYKVVIKNGRYVGVPVQ